MTDDATLAQNAAADPAHSTWLSANAGSGKTRVLTDRVARLLLAGTQPQNVLCLTYTKAAASEMQNRLFKRLGEWAMMDEPALRAELARLGEPPPDTLDEARTLFARAIETPGGLKIQTIHSFCSAILRQFPLEAGVSPAFREADEAVQKALLETVLDTLALTGDPSLNQISRIVSDETLTDLAASVAGKRHLFQPPRSLDAIYSFFGLDPSTTLDDIVAEAVTSEDLDFLRRVAPVISSSGGSLDTKLAAKLASLPDTPSLQALLILENCLLTGPTANTPFSAKTGTIPTKALRQGAFAPHLDRFNTIIERVETARPRRVSLDAALKTSALHDFAQALLPAYAKTKETAGVLDFDDLIDRASRLLTTRSLDWVLYRLDGRIEHILVDEAQDTSPAQWTVIDAIAQEITSGKGTRDNRTLFVVGDKKQSIYSFQGADAREFDRMHGVFRDRLAHGPALASRELHFSFRSSTAILGAVDATFRDEAGRGLGPDISHRAFHETLPGRVDLWPLIPTPAREDPPAWYDPVDRIAANDPRITLADQIAENIDDMIGKVTIPGENGISRLVRPGDILILVRGRGALFDHIIRACKARKLPMAGADRLRIGGELAVKDLLALLSFLALQEDDLSLASALRSPLFGWSESNLYDLAQGRKQPYLWAELRNRKADFVKTKAILDDLLGKVDFLRPFELLEYILSAHDGRRRLIARLGPEAEDGIDELLTQALAYETEAVPSLTGFLTFAQSEDIEIKRQADGTGDLIRVMTVHGAKGLESPIVILPDTTHSDRSAGGYILPIDDLGAVWRSSETESPIILSPARETVSDAEKDERQRLLYVAMTRAETWLIVCGTETANSKRHWHADVERGLRRLDAAPLDTPTGQGLRVSHGLWPDRPDAQASETVSNTEEIADFFDNQAAPQPPSAPPISPSDLGGDKALPGSGRDEDSALRHGRQIHRLLEHLPADADAACRVLASGPDPADGPTARALFANATAIRDRHPWLFERDGLSEVEITAQSGTLHRRILGTIDRLVVTPERITAVDYKSNPIVPARIEDVPDAYLRQMGAYLDALEQVYPDRPVEIAILWTETADLMPLPHAIVRKALNDTTTS